MNVFHTSILVVFLKYKKALKYCWENCKYLGTNFNSEHIKTFNSNLSQQFFKDHHGFFFFFSNRLTKHSSLGQMNLSTHNLKTKKVRITKISSLICYPWQSFLVDINSFKVESGDIFSSYFNIRFRTFFDLYFTISTKAGEFCCFR